LYKSNLFIPPPPIFIFLDYPSKTSKSPPEKNKNTNKKTFSWNKIITFKTSRKILKNVFVCAYVCVCRPVQPISIFFFSYYYYLLCTWKRHKKKQTKQNKKIQMFNEIFNFSLFVDWIISEFGAFKVTNLNVYIHKYIYTLIVFSTW
jgi:hypothetical protein